MALKLLKFWSKSKFMRKLPILFAASFFTCLLYSLVFAHASSDCNLFNKTELVCYNGRCKNNQCDCFPGWKGEFCQFCTGRVRLSNLSGTITDGPGNYSENNQCSWLIDPSSTSTRPIRLYLNHFATECSWDHLYIYDGGSIYDPLLAVFSGIIVKDKTKSSHVPQVVAKSGKALIYFYSDAAYNLTGFSIAYKANGCPSNPEGLECSGHGSCEDGICKCNSEWSGEACSNIVCPNNCFGHGICERSSRRCQCYRGYTGRDCKYHEDNGWWESRYLFSTGDEEKSDFDSLDRELERASHSTSWFERRAWIIGGHSFHPTTFVVAVNISDGAVEKIVSDNAIEPSPRYGHSSVIYEDHIYIFGGSLMGKTETRELWSFNPREKVWILVEPYSSGSTGDSFNDNHLDENSRARRDNRETVNFSSVNEDFLEREKKNKVNNNQQRHHHTRSGGDHGINDNEKRSRGGARSREYVSRGSCLHPSPSGSCSPVAIVGHSAVVVDHMMLVFFGYSSLYGTLSLVQEFHFKSRRWKVTETEGAVVSGTYGHSALWDPKSRLVYVHGGLESISFNKIEGRLLVYEPYKRKWIVRRPSPLPRFLHSSIINAGTMLVFGGNTHNDTSFSYGAKCFTSDSYLYDIECDRWHIWGLPHDLGDTPVARFGHSVISTENEMVVFGGFNGVMLSTSIIFHFGRCQNLSSKEKCLTSHHGRKCIWNRVLERCEVFRDQDRNAHDFCASPSLGSSNVAVFADPSDRNVNNTAICSQQTSCHSCLHNSYGCVWCNSGCSYKSCLDYTKGVIHPTKCDNRNRWWCKSLESCDLCSAYRAFCSWLNKECFTMPNQTLTVSLPSPGSGVDVDSRQGTNSGGLTTFDGVTASQKVNFRNSSVSHRSFHQSCPVACSRRTSCVNCTQGSCMWCLNLRRCVKSNSYLVSFPYGQCREWTTETRKCPEFGNRSSRCLGYKTCKDCQNDIACGWCDDGTGTGTGVCMEGGQAGPVLSGTGEVQLSRCPQTQWFFTDCPACNCNGHSHCVNDSVCVQPCNNNTEGAHCEKCRAPYFGKPVNGGFCQPCQCNNHGVTCDSETGVCHCHTKGVIGDQCERCDSQNNYYGEPLKGSCFYDLQIDYQFTFNLSKQEDAYIRRINFYNIPSKEDVPTDFDISCSKPVGIKISARQAGGHEQWILRNFTGASVERRFAAEDYSFGASGNNTTFHVYVFNFIPPIEIVISFSQYPKLDLFQFFSIFSLCFMALLLFAFVLWKIKQRFDIYARRQRFMIEMEAMASRPFCSIYLEMQKNIPAKVPSFPPNSPTKSPVNLDDAPMLVQIKSKDTSNGIPFKPSYNGVLKDISHGAVKDSNFDSLKDSSHGAAKDSNFDSLKDLSHGAVKDSNIENMKGCNNSTHEVVSATSNHLPFLVAELKNNPSPISLEPCVGNKAAVLSLLVELPTGGSLFTTPGHPGGLAVASSLVSLGAPPLSSTESSFFPKEGAKCPPIKKCTVVRLRGIPS